MRLRTRLSACIVLHAMVLEAFVLPSAPAVAQSVREHEIGGQALAFHGKTGTKITSTPGSADAIEIVQTIMRRIGLPMNLDVRAAPDVVNAQAIVETVGGREVRTILDNPAWVGELKKTLSGNWPATSIMAHEIGHHLSGHLDPAYANHPAELEADKFSGFILNRLGASLEQAQLAMAMISSDEATASHPGRSQRVQEIARGWNEAQVGQGANVIKSSALATLTRAVGAAVSPSPPPTIAPGSRVALLIGNTNYKAWTPLKNPKNDVIAIQRELRKLGFSTTTRYDGSSAQIAEYVRLFRDDAKDADWALFYFAGSGVEVDGVNYMVPIDADAERALTFTRDHPSMRLDSAYESIKQAKSLRLVVVDACRIDPAHLPGTPSATTAPHVFKVVEPPRGIVVAYSTRAGQYAADGHEDLSPYAQALIKALREPGIEFDKVFRRVTAQVTESSRGAQEPTVLGSWPAQDLYLSPR